MRWLIPLFCFTAAAAASGPVGYGAAAKGGEGGRVAIASSAEELRALAGTSDEPLVIRVKGTLRIGSLPVRSNKTIEAAEPGAALVGALHVPMGTTNVIIRRLSISNPTKRKDTEGFDGISIRGGRDIWVDQCTVFDCGDGGVDVTHGADRVTISRCKFFYSDKKMAHRFPILATGPPKKKSKGRLHLTLHSNWFAKNCDSRMPLAVKARVHQFNNFIDCPDNQYCSNARKDAEILSEGNVFLGVRNPLFTDDNGRIRSRGDDFERTHGKRSRGDDDVFKPPYEYTVIKAADVPGMVRRMAGAPGGP